MSIQQLCPRRKIKDEHYGLNLAGLSVLELSIDSINDTWSARWRPFRSYVGGSIRWNVPEAETVTSSPKNVSMSERTGRKQAKKKRNHHD